MKTLYLECNSGISGDMTVAALLDLGANREKLEQIIHDMHLGCRLHFGRAVKNGISAYDFDVELPHEHTHGHAHDHVHDHEHAHGHKHAEETASHVHRSLQDIIPIIENSGLPKAAKENAKKMFDIVAAAESKIHGLPIHEVHFHEVGAIDSIVDICAVAFCMHDLGIEKVIVSPVCEGTGEILCQHGIIPVPAPATLEILSSHKVPMKIKNIEGEMVTPTGAAVVAAYASDFGCPENLCADKIGYGAGKKDFAHANILRAFILSDANRAHCGQNIGNSGDYRDEIVVLTTNIDDASPEELGFCMEKLFKAGAKDAFFTPIYMKKSRPAYSLTVMCKSEVEAEAVRLIFTHTSSVGLRREVCERYIMDREKTTVHTEFGPVAANIFSYGDFSKISLEYDSVKALAEKENVSITQIYKQYKI